MSVMSFFFFAQVKGSKLTRQVAARGPAQDRDTALVDVGRQLGVGKGSEYEGLDVLCPEALVRIICMDTQEIGRQKTYVNGPRESILGCLGVVQGNDSGRELGRKLCIPSIVVLRAAHEKVASMDGEEHWKLARLGLVIGLGEEDAVCLTCVSKYMSVHPNPSLPFLLVFQKLTEWEASCDTRSA